MKKIVLSILTMAACAAYSQTTNQVVASSGGKGTAGGVSLNWTIGEPISKTLSNGTTTLGAGFQQGALSVTSIDEKATDATFLSVFPNPTTDKVIIKQSQAEAKKLRYNLYNLEGKEVASTELTSTEQSIDFSTLTKGVYILKVYSNKEVIKSYKIVKE